jgi:hypothetical protein
LGANPAAPTIVVANFSEADLGGWDVQRFEGETKYELVGADGHTVLRAVSRGSASGLVRRIDVDLSATPILRWRWKIDNTLRGNDERSKSGDDYPARVYVIRRQGLQFWKTEAINYVWSSTSPEGATWSNAYTKNSQMVAVKSGDRYRGLWQEERRDVGRDFAALFGETVSSIQAVAIMTDTDDTGQAAKAWYGDIWFSAR